MKTLLMGKGARGGVLQEKSVDWDAPVEEDQHVKFGATGDIQIDFF